MSFFLYYPEKFKGWHTYVKTNGKCLAKYFLKSSCSLKTGNNWNYKVNDVAMFQHTTSNMFSSAWFSKYKYAV